MVAFICVFLTARSYTYRCIYGAFSNALGSMQGRNRRCITLDLHTEEGRHLVRLSGWCMGFEQAKVCFGLPFGCPAAPRVAATPGRLCLATFEYYTFGGQCR